MTVKVTFQNNPLHASGITGGYLSYKLVPSGPLVELYGPSDKRSTGVMTALQFFRPDGHFDLFAPQESVDFDPYQTLEMIRKSKEL